ncbi:MAG TPA: DNA gyrase subunit A, partial [Cytophagales bacterium]|nr:DNA gyrase subunit A [Cytophagales bacterium]
DRLLDAALTNGNNHIIIAKSEGKAVHFHESDVRPMGRTASGVRGATLESGQDKVIGMVCITREDANLLVVSEKGYGKRSAIDDYRITRRGGKGVKTINVTEKTGKLVAIKEVVDNDELMIINKSGISIRIRVEELRVMGRATQGVRLIKLNEEDTISSVEKIQQMDDPAAESEANQNAI